MLIMNSFSSRKTVATLNQTEQMKNTGFIITYRMLKKYPHFNIIVSEKSVWTFNFYFTGSECWLS